MTAFGENTLYQLVTAQVRFVIWLQKGPEEIWSMSDIFRQERESQCPCTK